MKKWKQAALSVVAVSLLTATPAWAKTKGHEERLSPKEAWMKQLNQAEDQKSAGKVKVMSIKKLPVEMDRALKKVVKLLPELKDLKVDRVSIRDGYNGGSDFWYFGLTNNKRGNERIDVDIEIDAESGMLASYWYEYDYDDEAEEPTDDAGKAKADEFLKQLLGTDAKKYKLVADDEDEDDDDDRKKPTTHFNYQRFIHDIPLQDANIWIEISGEGQIVRVENRFTSRIREIGISKPKNVLSEKEAIEAYIDLMEMELLYNKTEPIGYPDDDDDDDDDYKGRYKTKPVLKYEPRYVGPMDAVKGEIPADLDFWEENKNEGEIFSISPKGEKLYAPNLAVAEELLTTAFGIDMSKFELEEEDDYGDDEKYYVWESISGDDRRYIELEVDGSTGEILDLDIDHFNSPGKPQISQERTIEIATVFMERFIDTDVDKVQLRSIYLPEEKPNLPSWIDEEEREDIEEEIRLSHTYSFAFHEVYQGAAVENDRFTVEVNAVTGEIEGVGYRQGPDTDLPDNENTASEEKAAKTFLKENPLKLTYIWPELFGYKAPKPILVYQPDPYLNGYIDAITGDFVERNERE